MAAGVPRELNVSYITRDPALVKNRIYVGNLPSCTRDELESIFHPYGKVLGSIVQKNFGFVQFESEEIANKCAAALNKSTFKSKTLVVRNASNKAKNPHPKKNAGKVNAAVPAPITVVPDDVVPINDCEIIVVNRENTKYAEFIEERLRQCGMRVDVLFPNEDVMLGKVLANISSRGCLYAVLVTPQHEELNSITVNILYGVPAEHRNMPVEDAIKLIDTDFRLKKSRDSVIQQQQQQQLLKQQQQQLQQQQMQRMPLAPAPPMQHDQSRHPPKMQSLLNMLAENRSLTALQYEAVIKYLQEQHEKQVNLELGEANAQAKLNAADPEIELQKKILSIMTKSSVVDVDYELMYSTFQAVTEDKRLMELLHDPRVMNVLESLYNSELVDTISAFL